MTNRLGNERSPYLRQHAENPVDWYSWGSEAFEKAKSEDKPVFLSIGYSTCHWCHVMAHESFEDSKVADILNRDYVSIKVDREERPDIDAVYMTVCQAMTGSGGWPLTVVMTPDQKPFFAATYLPKKGRFGQAGLTELLLYVSDLWEKEREKLLESAEKITEAVNMIEQGAGRGDSKAGKKDRGATRDAENAISEQGFGFSGDANADSACSSGFGNKLLDEAYRSFASRFDKKHGGFGAAPKFPSPHNLMFLMEYAQSGFGHGAASRSDTKSIQRSGHYASDTNHPSAAQKHGGTNAHDALHIAFTTLDAMAAGGIFDHIGGGFSRYSTDEKWLAPHFEKMLYDNALLLSAYTKAYRITQDAHYADIARRTADCMLRELHDPMGGFYCAQDADSEGVEGKYYVFTPDEIISVLGEKDGKEFCRMYDITDSGNFEGKSIPNLIKAFENNPHRASEMHSSQNRGDSSDTGIHSAQNHGSCSNTEIHGGLQAGSPTLKKLYDYRKARTALHTDDKILTSWTALAAIAFAQAGTVLEEPRYLETAVNAVRFIEENMTDERGRLFLRWHGGNAAHDGQLSDYAAYALALISLYRATLKTEYLKSAIGRAEQIIELFSDEKTTDASEQIAAGGFFQNAFDAEQLISRPKDTYDGAIPSGNSMAAMVFEELAELTGEIRWRAQADKQHEFMVSCAEISPADFSFAMRAFMKALNPAHDLICASADGSIPSELASYMKSAASENTNILFKSDKNAQLLAHCAPFTADYPIPDSGNLWYLCKNGACTAPSSDFYSLGL